MSDFVYHAFKDHKSDAGKCVDEKVNQGPPQFKCLSILCLQEGRVSILCSLLSILSVVEVTDRWNKRKNQKHQNASISMFALFVRMCRRSTHYSRSVAPAKNQFFLSRERSYVVLPTQIANTGRSGSTSRVLHNSHEICLPGKAHSRPASASVTYPQVRHRTVNSSIHLDLV
jgi:hypothetical protein